MTSFADAHNQWLQPPHQNTPDALICTECDTVIDASAFDCSEPCTDNPAICSGCCTEPGCCTPMVLEPCDECGAATITPRLHQTRDGLICTSCIDAARIEGMAS